MAALNPVQTAILNAIPQLTSEDLEAYATMASPNWLFPQREGNVESQRPATDLPHDLNGCQVPKYSTYGLGDVPAYSYVLRFTMLRDDDPYGQGVPPGTVGYWTHDGDGCFIDGHHQIHGVSWVGHNSSLAITNEQEWTVDLLLFGANCGWPENWDAFYNGYVNAILNSVWKRPHSHLIMDGPALGDTCGVWRKLGYTSNPGRTANEWVISDVMWTTVFSKIYRQSANALLRPTIQAEMLKDGTGRRALKILAKRLITGFPDQILLRSSPQLRSFDPHASVINRRLI